MLDKMSLTKVVWLIAGFGLALSLFFAAKDVWRNIIIELEMEQSVQMVDLSIALSTMVHEQQKERGASAVFLSSNGQTFGTELAQQRELLDARHEVALTQLKALKDEITDTQLIARLGELEQLIAQIPQVRQDIDGLRMTRKEAVGFYTGFNTKAISLVGYIAAGITDPGIVRELLVYRALMLGKDFAGLDRAIGASGFAVGAFDKGQSRLMIELPAKQTTYFGYVLSYASGEQQEQLRTVLSSARASELADMRAIALSGNPDRIRTIAASTWFDMQTEQIGELKALEDSMALEVSKNIEARLAEAQIAVFSAAGLLVVGLGVVAWMSLKFIGIIKRRISTIIGPLDQLAQGEINVDIADHKGTEFAPVTNAMRVFKDNAIAKKKNEEERKRVIATLRESLVRMASGNLEEPIQEYFAAEYKDIRVSFNDAQEALRDVIGQVVGSAQQISLGAEEVNIAASDLSSRAARQAATLEETTAALQKTNKGVQSSAELAQQTNHQIADTRANAKENEQMVDVTVSAMEQIQSSFKEVEKITSVIQDIAFQTNILALNAGVEATRAGEAGKGFGVVANEVRALAQRSSEAVTDIQQLMAKSSEHITNGARQVGSSGNALREMIKSIDAVGAAVDELAQASSRSAMNLNEIDAAIATLDLDTQQNAAMAEQSSAASNMLTQEVKKLNQGTSLFLGHGGSQDPDTSDRLAA